MSEINQRIESLETAVAQLCNQVTSIRLQMAGSKGEADAAGPLLEQRLEKIESAVGLLKLG